MPIEDHTSLTKTTSDASPLVHLQEHIHRFNWKISFDFLAGFPLHGHSNKTTENAAILWCFTQIQRGVLGDIAHKQLFQHWIYKTRAHRTWMESISFSPKFATVSATRAWIFPLSFCSPSIISLILSTLQTLSCEALIKWWIWQCSKLWEKLSKYKTLYTIIFIGCLLLSSLGNQQSFKRLRSQLCISMKNSTSRIARPFL